MWILLFFPDVLHVGIQNSEKDDLKELPAPFSNFNPEGSFPGGPIH